MKTFQVICLSLTLLGSTFFFCPGDTWAISPEWSYGGKGNPTQWGHLGHDFALCDIGQDQSPIDIDTPIVGRPSTLEFNYSSVPLDVVNTGRTIQVNYPKGSTVRIDGDEYDLLQFHFHTPSEHTNGGIASAMEMHLVHRNNAGELAVVGILMNQGDTHPAIKKVWEHIHEEEGTRKVEPLIINAADFLPESKAYFSYPGSLTTPPCSEEVRWNVMQDPIEVSTEQLEAFEALYPINARPSQPAHGRIIELHEDPEFP